MIIIDYIKSFQILLLYSEVFKVEILKH